MLLPVPAVIVVVDEDREGEEKEGRAEESANEQGITEYRLMELPMVVYYSLL